MEMNEREEFQDKYFELISRAEVFTKDKGDIDNQSQSSSGHTKQSVKAKIENAHKLGPKTCLIELDQQEKIKIMNNKAKLKNVKEEKIYINDDVTVREREIQKSIRKMAQEERDKGNEVQIG
ncbi:hypothetical protein ILUMI_06861 [Ignelater luminosus]|uniref:Uncharacterized protein n=1 Tax=Ignelater luminosus TaxID=2038154 RepID=A0A8K0D4I1_IGNLU|nr:hypothetical protein ILUMI_06861 [Ignelater luminosus]